MQGEYRGDFTRDTFDPLKHFSRVLMQQGRVQLDADWNEQTSILLHYLRALAADLIGAHGGPGIEGNPGNGFSIKPDYDGKKVLIGQGRYYVDGILCENEEAALTYADQAGYPFPDSIHLEDKANASKSFVAFLDVWERHVTCAQDESICEVALGGPDTATRAQVVWQVKVPLLDDKAQSELQTLLKDLYNAKSPKDKEEALKHINEFVDKLAAFSADGTPGLRARARAGEIPMEACNISPESQYRGAENQLYRVEIQRSGSTWNGKKDNDGGNGATAATFKWSRDNSSTIFPILKLADGTVHLASLGRDDRGGLKKDDWVEIVDDNLTLQGPPGLLLRIEAVNRDDMTVTLTVPDGKTLFEYKENDTTHPLLRRWDHKEGNLSEGAVLLTESSGQGKATWIKLEDGVEIQFVAPEAGTTNTYRAGDYWLIPARTATGDVEWPGPVDAPEALEPHGIAHHYAPLAVITLDGSGKTVATTVDLRRVITQLAK
jgi:Family of unknown function (DUF6519)